LNQLAWLLGALMLLSGCQQQPPLPAPPLVAIPAWVLDPQADGYETELGYAPAGSEGANQQQYRVAEMAAMRAFSQNQRVQVSSTITSVRIDGDDMQDESQARLSAANAMDFSKLTRLQTWVHPVTQDLYVLYGIPISRN